MTATSHTTADTPATDVGILMPVVVHFDDLDSMGLLHNGHYQVLVERAWGWFWRGKGVGGTSGLEGDGFNAAKTFDITYDRPIAGIGEYAVHLWMQRLGTTSATAGYRVCSADGKVTYAHGSRTVVRLDSATMRPTPWSGQVPEIARTLGLPEGEDHHAG
ncbi:thioesterase [Streptomyces sp. Act143]|uniref:acyl-CoA thioesterase n=1 Tax=Streptomyces sp. Act143 TaxID=2200760 RepID=UPI000D678379|nr:hotdog domain-containing protein [Streptomyces sp. Act143]PWI15325.1 thioesterase [Streptomyces sp. Act143]